MGAPCSCLLGRSCLCDDYYLLWGGCNISCRFSTIANNCAEQCRVYCFFLDWKSTSCLFSSLVIMSAVNCVPVLFFLAEDRSLCCFLINLGFIVQWKIWCLFSPRVRIALHAVCHPLRLWMRRNVVFRFSALLVKTALRAVSSLSRIGKISGPRSGQFSLVKSYSASGS